MGANQQTSTHRYEREGNYFTSHGHDAGCNIGGAPAGLGASLVALIQGGVVVAAVVVVGGRGGAADGGCREGNERVFHDGIWIGLALSIPSVVPAGSLLSRWGGEDQHTQKKMRFVSRCTNKQIIKLNSRSRSSRDQRNEWPLKE